MDTTAIGAKPKIEQAEHDRQRDDARASLPQSIRDARLRRLEAIDLAGSSTRSLDQMEAENSELREANAALEAEVARLKVDLSEMEGMRTQYEQGGFAKVIAGKDEEIRVLLSRLETESRDKVGYMRSADRWKDQANRLGYNATIDIDLETGAEVVSHG